MRNVGEPVTGATVRFARRTPHGSRPGADGLAGKRIDFVGLQATITDVLARVHLLDGTESTTLVHPSKAWMEVTGSRGLLSVAASYTLLGIEHIGFGIDHLLFVLALLIITNGTIRLLKTVTAFTVAHSITLALATLGFVHVPPKPVEAMIALSIVFVASEIVHSPRWAKWNRCPGTLDRGLFFRPASRLRICRRPQRSGAAAKSFPAELFFFNVGVELGQIAFIGIRA